MVARGQEEEDEEEDEEGDEAGDEEGDKEEDEGEDEEEGIFRHHAHPKPSWGHARRRSDTFGG